MTPTPTAGGGEERAYKNTPGRPPPTIKTRVGIAQSRAAQHVGAARRRWPGSGLASPPSGGPPPVPGAPPPCWGGPVTVPDVSGAGRRRRRAERSGAERSRAQRALHRSQDAPPAARLHRYPGAPLGSEHVPGPCQALLHRHRPPQPAALGGPAGGGSPLGARLPGWHRAPGADRGAAVAGQVHLRLGLPPRHGREDAAHRAHGSPGAHEHDHHRLHADLLQDHAGRGFLAVGEPILQRHRQLHQPQRGRPHHPQPAGDRLRECHHRGGGHGVGAQGSHQAPASHHRALRAFRGRGRCQLHQHPADEAEGAEAGHPHHGREREPPGRVGGGGAEGHPPGGGVPNRHGSPGHGYPPRDHERPGEESLPEAVPVPQRPAAGRPGGTLLGVRHPAVLRALPAEELHAGEPPGAPTPSCDPGEGPAAADRLLQQGAVSWERGSPRGCCVAELYPRSPPGTLLLPLGCPLSFCPRARPPGA